MLVEYRIFSVFVFVAKTGNRLRLNGAWGLELGLLVLLINVLTDRWIKGFWVSASTSSASPLRVSPLIDHHANPSG